MSRRAHPLARACLAIALSSCSQDRALDTTRGGVHPRGFADPSARGWHGKLLRDERWSPMLDASDPEACGGCHDGAPSRPSGVAFPAPGAPACIGCHTEPAGVLACGTCHGNPPRDGAHLAHTEPSNSRATGLPCSTCHPTPGIEVIGGLHGNGVVEVTFDATLAPDASIDRATGACAVTCHDRGGARPRPTWSQKGAMRCGDCHSSPPAPHYEGPCTGCHQEADAKGTSLKPGALHVNGRVDLGDGTGKCGACHGRGDDPWPRTGAHASHEAPTIATPVECASCHVVPASLKAQGHLNGVVELAFSGRAVDRGANPTWDGRACSNAACHGARLVDSPLVVPTWTDPSGAAGACGACHGVPPTQHTPSTSCDRSTCHGAEITRSVTGALTISPMGKALHINGVVDSVH